MAELTEERIREIVREELTARGDKDARRVVAEGLAVYDRLLVGKFDTLKSRYG